MKLTSVKILFPLVIALGVAITVIGRVGNDDSEPNIPGQFDYYLYVLSWSPQFCTTPNGQKPSKQTQCSLPLGFVIHGLWPEDNNGKYPDSCDPNAPKDVPNDIANMVLNTTPPMPPGDPEQLSHEWVKHGTCSGLGQRGYFSAIKSLTETIHIPTELSQPSHEITMSRQEIVDTFMTVNSRLTSEMIHSKSDEDGNISQISFCVNKQLQLQACNGSKTEMGGTFLPVR